MMALKASPDNTQVELPFSGRDIRLIHKKIGHFQTRCKYYFLTGIGIGIVYILVSKFIMPYEMVKILVILTQFLFFSISAFSYWRGKRLSKDLEMDNKRMLLTVLKVKRHYVGYHKVELILADKPYGLQKLFIPLTEEYLWQEGDLLSVAYLPASKIILHYENLRSTVNIH
ncbi:hypothetical protein SAMN05216436_102160 [bacterium A37T11]|nr:hypothetical protein SAMN05216436_102160 [bacterium A37T11]